MDGIDNQVALGVHVPQGPAMDPIKSMMGFASLQNTLNQNKLFQQTFAAKQKAGEILSMAPPDDPEAGVRALMQDPQTAPFAGEIISNIRGAQKALIDIQGAQHNQAMTAMGGFFKSLPSILDNPTKDRYEALMKSNLALMPKGPARDLTEQGMRDTYDGLTYGLPDDPQIRKNVASNRMVGLMVANGVTPDQIYGSVLPKQSFQDVGGSIKSVLTAPAQQGGGISVAGSLGKSLAPTLTTDLKNDQGQNVPTVFGGAAGGSGLAAQAPGVKSPGAPGASLSAPAGTPAGASGAPSGKAYGPTIESQKLQEASGQSAKEVQEDMQADAKALPSKLKQMDNMISSLSRYQAGGLAGFRQGVGQLMQGFKNAGASFVTQDMIDAVGNKSLSDSEFFQANVKPFVTKMLQEAATGTGRVMRSEVDAFLAMLNNATDPGTIMDVLNQARFALQVGNARAQAWPQYKSDFSQGKLPAGYGPGDFYTHFNNTHDLTKLPGATGGGQSLAPVPRTQALGVSRPDIPAPLVGKDLKWSASRKQWLDKKTGQIYDEDGSLAKSAPSGRRDQ